MPPMPAQRSPQAPISSVHHASRASLRVSCSIPRVGGICGDFQRAEGHSGSSSPSQHSNRGRTHEKVKYSALRQTLATVHKLCRANLQRYESSAHLPISRSSLIRRARECPGFPRQTDRPAGPPSLLLTPNC